MTKNFEVRSKNIDGMVDAKANLMKAVHDLLAAYQQVVNDDDLGAMRWLLDAVDYHTDEGHADFRPHLSSEELHEAMNNEVRRNFKMAAYEDARNNITLDIKEIMYALVSTGQWKS